MLPLLCISIALLSDPRYWLYHVNRLKINAAPSPCTRTLPLALTLQASGLCSNPSPSTSRHHAEPEASQCTFSMAVALYTCVKYTWSAVPYSMHVYVSYLSNPKFSSLDPLLVFWFSSLDPLFSFIGTVHKTLTFSSGQFPRPSVSFILGHWGPPWFYLDRGTPPSIKISVPHPPPPGTLAFILHHVYKWLLHMWLHAIYMYVNYVDLCFLLLLFFYLQVWYKRINELLTPYMYMWHFLCLYSHVPACGLATTGCETEKNRSANDWEAILD